MPLCIKGAINAPTQAIPPRRSSEIGGMMVPQELLPAPAAVSQGRDTLPTSEAARALNRANQTLRKWACLENGPIRPLRIHGRLAWRVSDLQALLHGNTAAQRRANEEAA